MKDHFETLIAEYGKKKGLDLVATDGVVELTVDDVPLMFVNLAESDEVSVMGEIGPAPAEGVDALMTAMMMANFAQQGSARGALARHPETGDFWLCRRLPIEGLDAERFDAAMTSFLEALLGWCEMLRNYRPAAAEPDARESFATRV